MLLYYDEDIACDSTVSMYDRATAKRMQASVQSMVRIIIERSLHSSSARLTGKFSFVSIFLVLAFILPTPICRAAPLQAASPQPSPAASAPALNESLRPALDQVGSALNQVQIDRWKLSREWKQQLRGDADSIEQDLSTQLPGLFQAAQRSSADLGPQLSVQHNVDALYDVLVRIATAASIAGGKSDAAILDSAVQRLESARKATASHLLQAVSLQDQQIARLKASVVQAAEPPANVHPKTIVVDNRVGHRTRHRKVSPHHKAAQPTPSTSTGAPASTPHPAGP